MTILESVEINIVSVQTIGNRVTKSYDGFFLTHGKPSFNLYPPNRREQYSDQNIEDLAKTVIERAIEVKGYSMEINNATQQLQIHSSLERFQMIPLVNVRGGRTEVYRSLAPDETLELARKLYSHLGPPH